MILLLVVLEARSRIWRRAPSTELRGTANALLSYLSLLFVPAGVGVITQLDLLGDNLLAVAAAIAISTLAGLVVTGWVMQRLLRPEPPPPVTSPP